MNRKRVLYMTLFSTLMFIASTVSAREFSGGGGSIYFGTGSPNSINAATELRDDFDINDESGNFVLGMQGFFQSNRYRIGGAIQAHAWAGFNPGKNEEGDETAGVAAVVGGFYSSYAIRHDRMLLNIGAIVGAGRCYLGYSRGDEGGDRHQSVSTFFIEPQISIGMATCQWFAVEFQLSAPIFLLTENLNLIEGPKSYTVKSSDLIGLNFSVKLTSGKIANPQRL